MGDVRCIFHEIDQIFIKIFENVAFWRKKCQVFKKFSNRFLAFGKNFQNLTFFLLERDLFHEIDQIFIKIFGKVVFYLKIFNNLSPKTQPGVFGPPTKIKGFCP